MQTRSRIRLACGQRSGAIDDAAAAVMATPWDPDAKALLGTTLLEERRFDEAIWFLGEALRADAANPAIQARLGQAFMLAGRHAAAAELLAHCAATAGGTPGLAALQAQNILLAGDAATAIALARTALAAGAADAALHSVLGACPGCRRPAGRGGAALHHRRPARAAERLPGAPRRSGDRHRHRPGADGYVASLFDGYAPRFEASLLGARLPGARAWCAGRSSGACRWSRKVLRNWARCSISAAAPAWSAWRWPMCWADR